MTEQPFGMVVIIVSDRAKSGSRLDETVPALVHWCSGRPFEIIEDFIVADEKSEIEEALRISLAMNNVSLVLTSGGTGFAHRDRTPEVVRPFLEKLTPGLDELLRSKGREVTPYAALSRGVSGIVGNKLVITLPGNPKAVLENMDWLEPILPHALNVLQRSVDDSEHHYKEESE